MKKRFFLILAATMIFAALPVIAQPAAQQYTCVMHPEIMMDQPDKCPKCGMTLVAKKPDQQEKRPTPKAFASEASNPPPPGTGSAVASVQRPTPNEEMHHVSMQSSVNVAEPMSRESSGSSWVPDSTPMYGKMFMLGDDMLMLHGGIFPRYTNANTRRGDDRIDAPNWFMATSGDWADRGAPIRSAEIGMLI